MTHHGPKHTAITHATRRVLAAKAAEMVHAGVRVSEVATAFGRQRAWVYCACRVHEVHPVDFHYLKPPRKPREPLQPGARYYGILGLLFEDRLTYADIAARFGVTRQRVDQVAKVNGCQWRRKRKPKEYPDILGDIAAGMYARDIARKYGLCETRIRTIAVTHNVSIKRLPYRQMSPGALKAIELIKQGFPNIQVAALTGVEYGYVGNLRMNYAPDAPRYDAGGNLINIRELTHKPLVIAR